MKRWQIILIIVALSTGFNIWLAWKERAIASAIDADCNKMYQLKDMT